MAYARCMSINKDAGAGPLGGVVHTTANAEECDIEGNPLYIFESVTDYIGCHYMEKLNLEARMGGPIAKLAHESFMAEVRKLGALLADLRTYKEAMKKPDAKQREGALSEICCPYESQHH